MVMAGPGEAPVPELRPVPDPVPGEAVVRVRASSLNYHDMVNLMGMILLAAGEPEEALEKFAGAIQLIGVGGVPDDVDENNRRNFLYWKTRVELARGRIDNARSELVSYLQQVEVRQIPFEQRRVNELAAAIALADGDATTALKQLEQANQQDPRVLYLTAMALREAGNFDEALAAARLVTEYNGLALRYAFVRSPAFQLLEELESQRRN